jgi:hypothetical protein
MAGSEEGLLAVRHHSSKSPLLVKHSEQPHTEPKKNQQTNKTISQTRAWQQQYDPYNVEESEAFTKKKSRTTLQQSSRYLHHSNLYT